MRSVGLRGPLCDTPGIRLLLVACAAVLEVLCQVLAGAEARPAARARPVAHAAYGVAERAAVLNDSGHRQGARLGVASCGSRVHAHIMR